MNKNDTINMEQYPGLIGLFWDMPNATSRMTVRDAFCILALRIGTYLEPENMNEKETRLFNELFQLFEDDIPEVLYNGWRHEKTCTG